MSGKGPLEFAPYYQVQRRAELRNYRLYTRPLLKYAVIETANELDQFWLQLEFTCSPQTSDVMVEDLDEDVGQEKRDGKSKHPLAFLASQKSWTIHAVNFTMLQKKYLEDFVGKNKKGCSIGLFCLKISYVI